MTISRIFRQRGSTQSLDAQVARIFAKHAGACHLWLPSINNWQDSAGASAAAVDSPVGRVSDTLGAVPLTQTTAGFRPVLRHGPKNLLTNSEFQNGIADATVRGGLVSVSAISGFAGAVAIGRDGVTSSFAYKTFVTVTGAVYTFAVFVQMDDGQAPALNSPAASHPSIDFTLVCNGAAISPSLCSVKSISGGIYRVSATVSANAGANFGVVKYNTTSTRTFRATGYQLVEGKDACDYKATTSSPLSTGGVGGKGAMWWEFDGLDDRLSCSTIINTSNPHALIVAGHSAQASATLAGQYGDANNVGPLVRFSSTLSTSSGYYCEASTIKSQVIATPPYNALERTVMSVRYSAGVVSVRRRSAEAAAAAVLSSIPVSGFNVGAGGTGATLSEFLKGGVYGVFVAQADLLRSEIIAIERWFARLIRASI